MLGLIANNFVRIYHPCTYSSNTNGAGSVENLSIDAAILAINHSFIVDNYDCGASLGTLNVNGAISQKYRGPVGTTRRHRLPEELQLRRPPALRSRRPASSPRSRRTG